jgi:hypothetical protein
MPDISHIPLDDRNRTGARGNRIRYAASKPDTEIHFHFLGLDDDGGDIWGVAVYHDDCVAQAFTVPGEELDPMMIELVRDGFNCLEQHSGGAVMEVSMKPEGRSLALVEQ